MWNVHRAGGDITGYSDVPDMKAKCSLLNRIECVIDIVFWNFFMHAKYDAMLSLKM